MGFVADSEGRRRTRSKRLVIVMWDRNRRLFKHHPYSIARIIFIYFSSICTEHALIFIYAYGLSRLVTFFVCLFHYAFASRHFCFSIESVAVRSNQSVANAHLNLIRHSQICVARRHSWNFSKFVGSKHLALIRCDRILCVRFRLHWMIFISVVIYVFCSVAAGALIWLASDEGRERSRT